MKNENDKKLIGSLKKQLLEQTEKFNTSEDLRRVLADEYDQTIVQAKEMEQEINYHKNEVVNLKTDINFIL